MHGPMPIVIKGEVQPLFVLAHETIGIVDAAFGAITGFFVQYALVRPRFQAVKADPE